MAISIDWPTKVITVPKTDTTLVAIGPPEIRSLDVDQFRKDLNALQAGEVGMAFDITHTHNPPVTVGGITLVRVVELINGYTVTFESGAYAVNLTGANNNISDVANLNAVSIRSANSAGLIQIISGSGLSAAQATQLTEMYQRFGLDPDADVVVEGNKITIGNMVITMVGDGITSTTTHRVP